MNKSEPLFCFVAMRRGISRAHSVRPLQDGESVFDLARCADARLEIAWRVCAGADSPEAVEEVGRVRWGICCQ